MTATPTTLSHSDAALADAVEAALKNHRVFQGRTFLGTYKHCELGSGGEVRLHGCDAKMMEWAHDIFRELGDSAGTGIGYKTELILRDINGSAMTFHGAWVSAAAHNEGMMTLSFDQYTTEGM